MLNGSRGTFYIEMISVIGRLHFGTGSATLRVTQFYENHTSRMLPGGLLLT